MITPARLPTLLRLALSPTTASSCLALLSMRLERPVLPPWHDSRQWHWCSLSNLDGSHTGMQYHRLPLQHVEHDQFHEKLQDAGVDFICMTLALCS